MIGLVIATDTSLIASNCQRTIMMIVGNYERGPNLPLTAVTAGSLRDQVVVAVREGILRGSLRPGERLTETDLARQLKTSRGPIREALRQLEQEGLVRSYPYRGTEVVGVSQEEVEQVLVPIRLIVEEFSFRHAVTHLTDNDFADLIALIEEMRSSDGWNDQQRLADLDVQFHELVVQRGDQAQAYQIWKSVQPRVRAHFIREAFSQTADQIAAEHQELIDALRTGDAEIAAEAIRKHVRTYPSAAEQR